MVSKRQRKSAEEKQSVEQMAYRFCGKPSDRDIILEAKTFGCCRYLWNRMLGDHNTLYNEIGEVPNNTPADYKDLDECSWLREVDSLALANVQLNLDRAFDGFFSGRLRHPKFKAKKYSKLSYTTNAVYSKDGKCNITLDAEAGTLKHPKHKDLISLNAHRKIRSGGRLKSVTVTLEPDGKYYYSILMEYPKTPVRKVSDPKKCIALDMSLPRFYVDQNNNAPDFPKPYRAMERKLAKEQRSLSRKKNGSNNYEAQRQKVAKLHAKAKHQRADFLHKLSYTLTEDYDLIAIEDLDMAAMKQCLKFGKSVSDNGWGMFVNMLIYKAERKGKILLKVDKWFPSSKTCCHCGYVHKELTMSDRTYICPCCGHVMDRDEQAAINILTEAKRMLGLS